MLEELTAKNLLSFRDEVSLSFEATNDTMGEEQLVTTMPDGKRLLRLAMMRPVKRTYFWHLIG